MNEEIIFLAESCTGGQFSEMNHKLGVGSTVLFLERQAV